jgi:hypothetical protein
VKYALLGGSVLGALFLCAPVAHAKEDSIHFKQLAGPPGEIAQMRAPDPAAGAIHSKAALLAVELAADESGGYAWTGTLPVERGDLRFLALASDGQAWDIALGSPSGDWLRAESLATEKRAAGFGTEGALIPGELYGFQDMQRGFWQLRVKGANAGRGFLLVEGDPATELTSHLAHGRQLVGERIAVVAMLSGEDARKRAVLGREAGRIDSATLRVTFPDGSVETFPMREDASHGPGAYAGSFPAKSAGQHVAQVIVSGRHAHGAPLLRTAEHLIPVVEPAIALDADLASVKAVRAEPERLALRVPVHAGKGVQHHRAFAEVWGRGADGRPVPVAWIGGMVVPEGGAISLALDENWIALAKAQEPFELRNLRIEDPDHFVTVAEATRIALDLPPLSVTKAAHEVVIDERMRMGPRPPLDEARLKSTGRRLVLVHGYCSGGVWPTAHFTNASTFLDRNQNRSHDQFARLLRDFGAQWASFGTVAHSQGGAASLHLYTYYWSGLDNAVGNRLIQSVGTPYQGTNIAGILAALGNWFGVGCGSNSNLTYSGAASWLAGIPNWARGKVNYYTTSFATAWWRYDYCHMATDLVLSDPEDGTVERVYAQLSGGVNRGHTTGQCHTTGMRDPAQYLDANRNSIMNSNAAR